MRLYIKSAFQKRTQTFSADSAAAAEVKLNTRIFRSETHDLNLLKKNNFYLKTKEFKNRKTAGYFSPKVTKSLDSLRNPDQVSKETCWYSENVRQTSDLED